MKTSTNEVRCDGCEAIIPALSETAIRMKLQGPGKHKYGDFCNTACFQYWVREEFGRMEWA